MVKKVGKYEIGRTLGEGTFGKCVYSARNVQIFAPGRQNMRPPVRCAAQGQIRCKHGDQRARRHQDIGQREDPEAKYGRADQERNSGDENGQAAPRSKPA